MAKTRSLTYPKSCLIPIPEAAEKIMSGPRAMQSLLSYLNERTEVMTQQTDLVKEFCKQWGQELPSIMAPNLEDSELKAITCTVAQIEEAEETLHAHFVARLNKPGGVMEQIKDYVNYRDEMAIVTSTKNYFSILEKRQELEADVHKSKMDYLDKARKADSAKELVAWYAMQGMQGSQKLYNLEDEVKQLETDARAAQDVYINNVEREQKTRRQFIKDTNEYWLSTEDYETERIEMLIFAIMGYLHEEKDTLAYSCLLEEQYDRVLRRLDNYGVTGDLIKLQKACKTEHKFPRFQPGGERTCNNVDGPDENATKVPKPEDNATIQSQEQTTAPSSESCEQSHVEAPRTKPVITDPDVKTKVFALQAFTATRSDEISFKAGQKVYKLTAPDSEGISYGYIKKGRIRTKKVYGFFPGELVSPDARKKRRFAIRNLFKRSTDTS